MQILAVGLGATGMAVVRHGTRRRWGTVVVEDDPTRPGHDERRDEAVGLGATVVETPSLRDIVSLVEEADLVVPSPGVMVAHPVYQAARDSGTAVVSEIELASRVAMAPIVAVTGTNGKSTVTTLVTEMLRASGKTACAAGNIGRPLLDAVEDDVEVIVAEVSSFQLQYTDRFRPAVAVVLNLAEDHFDWHPSFRHYRDAKARVFARQEGEDVAVLNADDSVVAAMADVAPARVTWFSASGTPGAYRVSAGDLVTPEDERIVAVADLPRAHPHDVDNALAAAAAARAAGATIDGVVATLLAAEGLPHRLALVGDAGGVRWYDDSKATNPHATLAALSGFDSAVLLAGGRNKGLPLAPLAAAAPGLRAVVAFGEAAREVEDVFSGLRPVTRVVTMRDAVEAASKLARPGDAVVLSPACASFDAYPDYAARGDDFTAEVRRVVGQTKA